MIDLYRSSKGELVKYYLEKFIDMRDNHLDDLPNVDVRFLVIFDENDQLLGRNYKCRGNYIWGLSLRLQAIIKRNIVTDNVLIEKIKQLDNHEFKASHCEFTTQEEIDMMNDILNDVIDYLQKINDTIK